DPARHFHRPVGGAVLVRHRRSIACAFLPRRPGNLIVTTTAHEQCSQNADTDSAIHRDAFTMKPSQMACRSQRPGSVLSRLMPYPDLLYVPVGGLARYALYRPSRRAVQRPPTVLRAPVLAQLLGANWVSVCAC